MLLQMLPQCYTTKNSLHDAWKSNIITNNTAKRKANQRLKDTKQYTLKYMQYFTLVQTKTNNHVNYYCCNRNSTEHYYGPT